MSYGTSTEAELREVDALTPGSPPVAARAVPAALRRSDEDPFLPALMVAGIIIIGLVLCGIVSIVRDASMRSIDAHARAIEDRANQQWMASVSATMVARAATRRADDLDRRLNDIQRQLDAAVRTRAVERPAATRRCGSFQYGNGSVIPMRLCKRTGVCTSGDACPAIRGARTEGKD